MPNLEILQVNRGDDSELNELSFCSKLVIAPLRLFHYCYQLGCSCCIACRVYYYRKFATSVYPAYSNLILSLTLTSTLVFTLVWSYSFSIKNARGPILRRQLLYCSLKFLGKERGLLHANWLISQSFS